MQLGKELLLKIGIAGAGLASAIFSYMLTDKRIEDCERKLKQLEPNETKKEEN